MYFNVISVIWNHYFLPTNLLHRNPMNSINKIKRNGKKIFLKMWIKLTSILLVFSFLLSCNSSNIIINEYEMLKKTFDNCTSQKPSVICSFKFIILPSNLIFHVYIKLLKSNSNSSNIKKKKKTITRRIDKINDNQKQIQLFRKKINEKREEINNNFCLKSISSSYCC